MISEAAGQRLVELYVELRKQGQDRGNEKRVTATTRQLESMIRMSEAHARMRWVIMFCDLIKWVGTDPFSRLSETVEPEDVDEASRLLREAIKDYATDPKTGRIDMDLILMGRLREEQPNQQEEEEEN